MKSITINLYELKELSPEARDRAIKAYRDDDANSNFGLEDDMRYHLDELLKEHTNITQPENIKVYYSLSYCQGDGAMFTGNFVYKNKYIVTVVHSGHYYHENSKDITVSEIDTDGYPLTNIGEDIIAQEFDTEYKAICADLAQYGYECIESHNSDENITDIIESNGYTYEADGTMRNA